MRQVENVPHSTHRFSDREWKFDGTKGLTTASYQELPEQPTETRILESQAEK